MAWEDNSMSAPQLMQFLDNQRQSRVTLKLLKSYVEENAFDLHAYKTQWVEETSARATAIKDADTKKYVQKMLDKVAKAN